MAPRKQTLAAPLHEPESVQIPPDVEQRARRALALWQEQNGFVRDEPSSPEAGVVDDAGKVVFELKNRRGVLASFAWDRGRDRLRRVSGVTPRIGERVHLIMDFTPGQGHWVLGQTVTAVEAETVVVGVMSIRCTPARLKVQDLKWTPGTGTRGGPRDWIWRGQVRPLTTKR
jgi:hypothetical protein